MLTGLAKLSASLLIVNQRPSPMRERSPSTLPLAGINHVDECNGATTEVIAHEVAHALGRSGEKDANLMVRRCLVLMLMLSIGSGCAETTQILDAQGQQEYLQCGIPEKAVAPSGTYRNHGLRLEYDRLVPLPDPRRNVDQGVLERTITTPARLEQGYYDATHGQRRAAWLACGFDAAARSSGRTIAQKLAGIRCQVLTSCSLDFKRVSISTETASGIRILTLTVQSLEAESRRLRIQQELVLRTAQLVVGFQLARQVLREVAMSTPLPRNIEGKMMAPGTTAETRTATAGSGVIAIRSPPSLPTFARGGKTVGVLRTASGDLQLQSGRVGPASSVPQGTSGFDIVTRTHVEGHAAAAMRAEGISEATLYINNPNICPSCSTLLPRMLPPGSRLTVVTPNGSRIFIGSSP